MARKNLNLGNLLVILGMGWLGFSFWLPYATAERVFRLESRASEIAHAITALAKERRKLDWRDPAVRDAFQTEVNRRCGLTDPTSSLYLQLATPPPVLRDRCFMLAGKHYLYMVANTPERVLGRDKQLIGPGKPPPTKDRPPELPLPTGQNPPNELSPTPPVPLPLDDLLPFETYAWPKDLGVGARTVFFVPSDGEAAFTRNLNDRYVGHRRPPNPGDGRFDINTEKRENAYRGRDDERWIYQTTDSENPR